MTSGRRVLERWRAAARSLAAQVAAVAVAIRDPRTPGVAKGVAVLVIAYALSPIDLVPDFIPVLGLLDDLLLVPAGVWLVIRLLPPGLWDDCVARARLPNRRPRGAVIAALVIVGLWVLAVGILWRLGWSLAGA